MTNASISGLFPRPLRARKRVLRARASACGTERGPRPSAERARPPKPSHIRPDGAVRESEAPNPENPIPKILKLEIFHFGQIESWTPLGCPPALPGPRNAPRATLPEGMFKPLATTHNLFAVIRKAFAAILIAPQSSTEVLESFPIEIRAGFRILPEFFVIFQKLVFFL